MVIINGIVDKGREMPRRRGNNSFINNPTNISNAMLKPTENRKVFTKLVSCNLNNLRMRKPGTIVK